MYTVKYTNKRLFLTSERMTVEIRFTIAPGCFYRRLRVSSVAEIVRL